MSCFTGTERQNPQANSFPRGCGAPVGLHMTEYDVSRDNPCQVLHFNAGGALLRPLLILPCTLHKEGKSNVNFALYGRCIAHEKNRFPASLHQPSLGVSINPPH